MSSKTSVLIRLEGVRDDYIQRIAALKNLETNRLYKFNYKSWWGSNDNPVESYGYIKAFNKDSFRVQMVATNSGAFSMKNNPYRRQDSTGATLRYTTEMIPVKRSELLLLMDRKFIHPDLAGIISRKKHIKLVEEQREG
jgi:hypothetical protein